MNIVSMCIPPELYTARYKTGVYGSEPVHAWWRFMILYSKYLFILGTVMFRSIYTCQLIHEGVINDQFHACTNRLTVGTPMGLSYFVHC